MKKDRVTDNTMEWMEKEVNRLFQTKHHEDVRAIVGYAWFKSGGMSGMAANKNRVSLRELSENFKID